MPKQFVKIVCAFMLLLSPAIGRAATVAPNEIELSSLRGQRIQSSFTILNTGMSEQTYFLDLLAFEPAGEDGTPLFIPEKRDQDVFLSWINFPVREVLIPATSKVDVPFTIVIPDDVPAGSYYGAITVSTAPSDIVASNGATIEAKTAILVFLTIEGETTESLELLDFTFDQPSVAVPFGTFRYRLQNQGNVHLTPTGEMTLTNVFGQVIAVVDANEAKGRALPSSTRGYEIVFGSQELSWVGRAGYQLRHLILGPVTAQLDLSYGQEGSIQTQLTTTVVPVELIVVLGSGLLIVELIYQSLPKR